MVRAGRYRPDPSGTVRVVGELRRYLEERETARTRGLERGGAVGCSVASRRSGSGRRRRCRARALLAPVERRKAGRLLAEARPLRLHLGAGTHRPPGWVNVDVLGMAPDLAWDLRRRLPFPDGAAEAVFLEHVLEHFTLAAGLDLLDECRRVVRPGGIVRVGVPDFGRYLESYAGDGDFVERLRPGRPTRLLAVGEVALGHGHRPSGTPRRSSSRCGSPGSRTPGAGHSATRRSRRRPTTRPARPRASTPKARGRTG